MLKAKHIFTLLFSSILVLLAFGCENQDELPIQQNSLCNASGEIVLQAFGRKGLAYYDAHQNLFTIQTAIEVTYDSVDIGIVCNMPADAQDEIKAASANQKLVAVVFSGTYRKLSDPDFGTPIPGHSYYALTLSSFNIESISSSQ